MGGVRLTNSGDLRWRGPLKCFVKDHPDAGRPIKKRFEYRWINGYFGLWSIVVYEGVEVWWEHNECTAAQEEGAEPIVC